MRQFLICTILLSISIAQGIKAWAQQQPTDTNLDTGIKPYETYDRAQENVNIAGGNLNVQIPLVHFPGRNGQDFDLSLTYNSQIWTPVASLYQQSLLGQTPNVDQIDIGWTNSDSWQLNIPVLYATGVTTLPSCISIPLTGCANVSSYTQSSQWTNFYLVMGDGRKYQFPYATFNNFVTTAHNIGNGFFTYQTGPYTYADDLMDYDYPGPYNGGGGEGVMLDLTNAASGTGTAVVRFRDGRQLLFSIAPSSYNGYTYMAIGQGAAAEDGTAAFTASSIVDSNGNVISINPYASNGTMSITDTLGRSITVLKGFSGVQYTNSNGNSQQITFNHAKFPSNQGVFKQPAFSTPTVGSGVMSVNSDVITGALSSVVLPNNLTYTFQYNEFGELLEITYPSGGYTRYTYQGMPNFNSYDWSTALSGSADARMVVEKDTCSAVAVQAGAISPSGYAGSSVANTCPVAESRTTYDHSSQLQTNVVKVIDPLGNRTDYTFYSGPPIYIPSTSSGIPQVAILNRASNPPSIEYNRNVYQGTTTLLRTVASNYQKYIYKSSETTTLYPSQMQSLTTWSYDTAINSYANTEYFSYAAQSFSYGNYAETDNVLTKKEYGFGQGTPGSLLRNTVYTYLATNPINSVNYQALPVYILNRKQSETVYGGSSNQLAQTNYTYDSYGTISASGAVQHGTSLNSYVPSYTTRGNVTGVYSDGLSTGYTYDDAGNVLSKSDSLGHATTYSYTDNWGNSTCAPRNASAYVTKVMRPLGESSQYFWNSCTGTMASMTDTNSQTTRLAYDFMDRRVQAIYPDSGQTTLQYSDDQGSSLPIQIQTTKLMNSGGAQEISTVVLDGVSRVAQTQLNSDPWGTDYVNTTYDASGNVASITNPFRSIGESTDGVTQYQYDALGRKILQIQQDGSLEQWCYEGLQVSGLQTSCSQNLGSQTLGSWVDFSDETGRHWQRTTDALGRLVKVLEPGGGNAITASPTNETDYSYDALGNLLRVDQWNGSYGTLPNLSRTFIYDGLSRLTASTNPEAGTTTYIYQNSGGSLCSGDPSNLCFRTDANGTTTSYSYDQDNELIGKTYSDSTPPVTFVYQHGSGNSSNNANGRLIQEYTGPSSSPLSSTNNIAYDQMGRDVQEQQCVLGNCTGLPASTTGTALTRSYDLVGDMTNWTAGVPIPNSSNPITLTAAYDLAGRLGKIASSWIDSQHPDTPFWAMSEINGLVPYGPVGLNTAQLAYTSSTTNGPITISRNYDKRLRVLSEFDTGVFTNPAVGTITISGNEQSEAKSYGVGSQDSTGSFSISGSEQSEASTKGVGSKAGSGSITISGSEQSAEIYTPEGNFPIYDGGTISITVGNVSATYYYGESDTPETISNSLASQINSAKNSAVSASGDITFTSKTTGANTDYPISTSVQQDSNANLFNGPSFSLTPSGSTLTGGQNGTLYDSGSVTMTVNGHSDSASFGQGSTPSSIALALANAINADSAAFVTARASTSTVNLTSKQTGTASDWPVNVSVSHDSADFTSTSFSASSASLNGGQNGTLYDTGTVTVTVNGHSDSVSYQGGSTAASIASALQTAINSDGSAPATASASGATLTLTTKQMGPGVNDTLTASETYDTADFSANSFSVSTPSSTLTGGAAAGTAYSYQIPASGGYDANGNLLQVQDSVTGNWSYSYDSLNRLLAGTEASGPCSTLNLAWVYDNYGNRKSQNISGSTNCSFTQPGALTFNGNNNRADQFSYDNAGHALQDLQNQYLYDAEGRLCAVYSSSAVVTLYLYDADGTRVAKGSGSFSCNPSSNGFSLQHRYILGASGEQMTEMDGAGNWVHTNIFASGKLLSSYTSSTGETTFALNDGLGTKRAQAKYDGTIETTFSSLPYGDQLPSNSTGATEQFYTGKERDNESGNDYFGARYYASSMGRWLSPDWSAKQEPVPYAKLDNPQSLNLYAYVLNNPLSHTDPDGHTCKGGSLFCTAWDFVFHHDKRLPPPPPSTTPQPPGVPAPPPLKFKPNVPVPAPNTGLGKLLQCTNQCMNPVPIGVSSTSETVPGHPEIHGPDTPHGRGEAADLTPGKSEAKQTLWCSAQCGAGFGQNEYDHPSAHATGAHDHVQTGEGRGGSRGDLPANEHPEQPQEQQ